MVDGAASAAGAGVTESAKNVAPPRAAGHHASHGDLEHLKIFANADAAGKWFEENDPEGVVLEYEVLE
ncbi:hypothetical protein [Bradyrhizobium jicamae]|uniref:hypothetical protein n=1 Tax=Bradyrhizobium jicamae TaxID=280332 RepID=UPI000709868C|nr:hypothetical protein [Bradyrhizobium jicamae]